MSEFDFRGYVTRRDAGVLGGTDEESRYAYGPDLAMLRAFRRLRPVELAVSAVVRSYKSVLNHSFMGSTVRVSPQQLPRMYRIAKECADTLGVAVPTLYVMNSPVMNAFTFGTDEDSIIVVHSKLIDDFTDEELKFVVGHEMGHIQNKHVVYGTALRLLKTNLSIFLRWIAPPAEMALAAWARRAEITCDRAGLLCVGDLQVAERTFMKMACGSTKLYDELDTVAYLEQLEATQQGMGRLGEMLMSHPYLPKRIRALQIFAESALYRTAVSGDLQQGLTMPEVDERVNAVVQIVGSMREELGLTAPAALPEADESTEGEN